VYIRETTWLEPDVAVYPVAAPPGTRWQELPPPALVIEVSSPLTIRRDRHRKRPEYLRHGVGEVWLVDPDATEVERWTKASDFPEKMGERIKWTPRPDIEPFAVELAAVIEGGE
jgi:Uma2 family endonuclease